MIMIEELKFLSSFGIDLCIEYKMNKNYIMNIIYTFMILTFLEEITHI